MKAVFFDIDGTLWDETFIVPDSAVDAIRQLRKNGHLAFINTGRASTDFIKALCNLKGNQRSALLRRMVKADYTTESQLSAAKAYIKA